MSQQPFTYNASALALGGFLNIGPAGNRTRTIVPSVASVALSPTGGEGRVIVENYSNQQISFTYAQSSVFGYESGGAFITRSEVVLTGLNVFNRLKIAMMHATVESRHDSVNASFTNVQASYSGVEIDGVMIEPQLDLSIGASCPTFQHLENKLLAEKHIYAPRFGMTPAAMTNALSGTAKPQVCGSLAADFTEAGSTVAVPKKAYGLQVQNFGRAHFAEYHVKPGRRRVTLLRLDLDTMADFVGTEPEYSFRGRSIHALARREELDGTISIASTDGNGSPPWKP